jgi:hypothetical protein
MDFDIQKEPWNKYEISDLTILKVRQIIKRVTKVLADDKVSYGIDGDSLSVVLAPDSLKGTPDDKTYSRQELEKLITNDNMRYNTLAEEWNEYVLDDGGVIRIKATVSRVAKTSKFDRNGDPIYIVETSSIMQIRPPKP